MEIIVCIKQVPDTTEVRIDPETKTLIREGVSSTINPYDKYALEAALRLREEYGGKISAISMGPPQAADAIRETYSRGVDAGYLLTDSSFAGADTLATAYTLAAGIRKIGRFDLIICGKQAIDGDTAQVGPELAELLDIPQVAYVRKIGISEGLLIVERELEGRFEKIELSLPALFTVTNEVGELRSPSLKEVLKAKNREVVRWGAEDLGVERDRIGLSGSATRVVKIFYPPKREDREILEGDTGKVVGRLIDEFKKRMII